jgi:hypothetical protein
MLSVIYSIQITGFRQVVGILPNRFTANCKFTIGSTRQLVLLILLVSLGKNLLAKFVDFVCLVLEHLLVLGLYLLLVCLLIERKVPAILDAGEILIKLLLLHLH